MSTTIHWLGNSKPSVNETYNFKVEFTCVCGDHIHVVRWGSQSEIDIECAICGHVTTLEVGVAVKITPSNTLAIATMRPA